MSRHRPIEREKTAGPEQAAAGGDRGVIRDLPCDVTTVHQALERYPGPLFMPRLTSDIRLLWTVVVGALLAAFGIGTALVVESFGLIKLNGGVYSVLLVSFLMIFAFGPPAFAVVYFLPVRKRLARRLLRARLRLCVYCGHELSGRPAGVAECPECGHTIATRDAVAYWRAYLRGSTPPRV